MNGENLILAFNRIRQRFRSKYYAEGMEPEIEDALQEAFCRLWSYHADIEDVRHAEGLLTKASHNIRIDMARKKHTHPERPIEDSDDRYEDSHDEEDIWDVYTKVDRLASRYLSGRDRDILYLRDKNGWEFEDIARYFGLSETNVRMIVSRSRKTLRSLYLNKT